MMYIEGKKANYVITVMSGVASAHPELDVNVKSRISYVDHTIVEYTVHFTSIRTGELYARATIFMDEGEFPVSPDEGSWKFFGEEGRKIMTPIFTRELANKFAWLTIR